MSEAFLLKDIVIILGLAVAVSLVFQKFKIPNILGLLITGIIAGPYGLALIGHTEQVNSLAEIGIVLLMFAIGIEFSLKNLYRIRKEFFGGGILEVILSLIIVVPIAIIAGYNFKHGIFWAFLITLSSTAIALKVLQEKGSLTSHSGRLMLALLVFQDIIAVPFMLLTPLISGTTVNNNHSYWLPILKVVLLFGLLVLLIKFIIPKLFYLVSKTKSSELFLLTTIAICLIMALLANEAGLSLALGAFLAGLAISESDYSSQAFGNIIPFRDIFASFFFVSIGMLLDLHFVASHLLLCIVLGCAVIAIKFFINLVTAIMLGYSLKNAGVAAILLAQIGEFAFVLAGLGVKYNILGNNEYQYFLAVTIFSMAFTPFGGMFLETYKQLVQKSRLPLRIKNGLAYQNINEKINIEKHVIIIGYGICGKNVANAANIAEIPYVIIEMNPETVRKEKQKGEKIIFGDATLEPVLHEAGITTAEMIVITIPDPSAVKSIVKEVRRLHPTLYILIRTRFLLEVKELLHLGADEVIPEEFETSIEIFSRMLVLYKIPRDKINVMIDHIRTNNYQMLRTSGMDSFRFTDLKLHLPGTEIKMIQVKEKSFVSGKKIIDLNLRSEFGVSILAVKRDSEVIENPVPQFIINDNDELVMLGKKNNITKFAEKISGNEI